MPSRRVVSHCILLLATFHCDAIFAVESGNKNDEVTEVKIESPAYRSPQPSGFVHLAENFDDANKFDKTWVKSEAKKNAIDEEIAKYDGSEFIN